MSEGCTVFTAEEPEAGLPLGRFLRQRGVSLSVIRALKFTEEGLRVNGRRARTDLLLAAGDTVCLAPAPRPLDEFSAKPQSLPITVAYESADAMVLDKPPGQVVHPNRRHPEGSLANAFCGMMQARGQGGAFRPIGRLDGDTSGLVLCAMNPAAAHTLNQSFEKTYLAIATGRMAPGGGTVDAPLGRCEDSPIKQQVCGEGRPSRTDYEVLAAVEQASLVRVWPRTGRTHQIRVHFAHIGHPLLGDALYGGGCEWIGRHALHCGRVTFRELCSGPVCVQTPPPQDMCRAMEALGLSAAFT